MATNLAQGSLVAWCVPEDRLHEAFDYMFQKDPFSGHVVIRSTDTPGRRFALPALDDAEGAAGILDSEACEYLAGRSARPSSG